MTLHWWMHWFWITAQILVSLTRPLSAERCVVNVSSKVPMNANTKITRTSESKYDILGTEIQQNKQSGQLQQNNQTAETTNGEPAIHSSPESIKQTVTMDSNTLRNLELIKKSSSLVVSRTIPNSTGMQSQFENTEKKIDDIHNKKEEKVSWAQPFTKRPKTKLIEKTVTPTAPMIQDRIKIPLQENEPRTLYHNTVFNNQKLFQTTPTFGNYSTDELLFMKQTMKPQIIVTAASVFNGDPTRLGRAREAFSNEFEQDYRSDEKHSTENQKDPITQITERTANMKKILTVIGTCLAILILFSIFAALCFITYRRKYLNPPQPLNSDKCSNPDSSGYIDDSTIRDNSEEMYSLDNDSFLNSLEAMTIQNYWTDSVKHTKL